ncbi:MAG: hypothetical protein WD003_01750 [Candidatus Paceibacterota bacterium]
MAQGCPSCFGETSNEWNRFARHLHKNGIGTKKWSFAPSPEQVRKYKILCLELVLSAEEPYHETKYAVAAWILSSLLQVVPPYKKATA